VSLTVFDEVISFASFGNHANDAGPAGQQVADAANRVLRIDNLFLGNDDAAPTVVVVSFNDAFANTAPLGAVSIPAGAGVTGPAVEAFDALFPGKLDGVVLPVGTSLFVDVPGTAGAGKVVTYLALGGYI